MKTAALGQPKIETPARDASSGRVVVRTAETSPACSTPEQQLRSWRVGTALTATRKAIAQWRRRVRTWNELTTLSEGHVRDIRRTRIEVEVARCKAFWWA
jgi:uncharacterized protein YjiS (DUF1127 family)